MPLTSTGEPGGIESASYPTKCQYCNYLSQSRLTQLCTYSEPNTYIHTCIHTYIHAYTHIYIHIARSHACNTTSGTSRVVQSKLNRPLELHNELSRRQSELQRVLEDVAPLALQPDVARATSASPMLPQPMLLPLVVYQPFRCRNVWVPTRHAAHTTKGRRLEQQVS